MARKKQKVKKEKGVEINDAPLSKRFIAYLIDWYIGALATAFPIAVISQKLNGTMLNQDITSFQEPYGMIGGVLALICACLYYIVVPMYVTKGQTLGKRICKVKIVKDNNKDVDLLSLLLRQMVGIIIIEGTLVSASALWHQLFTMITGIEVVGILMYAGFVLTGASVLMVAFSKSHKAIHDYLGNTKVVCVE